MAVQVTLKQRYQSNTLTSAINFKAIIGPFNASAGATAVESIVVAGSSKPFLHLHYYLSPDFFLSLKSIRKADVVSLTRLRLVFVSATREVELPTIRSK